MTENELQSYLADYPDLIPGDQIDPESPRRWLLVAREMGIPDTDAAVGDRWSLDHLFLDQDGMPTFVEVKRAVDTRTRREVVAQMLDYAANGLEYWSIERLRQSAAETARQNSAALDARVGELLGANDQDAIGAFWDTVEENLRRGRVRLLFVVDKAPRELRRLAEFLNEKMNDVQVLIVEIKQYRGPAGTALSPLVLGITQAVRDQKLPRRPSPRLTYAEFFALCPPESAALSTKLMELAREFGCTITWNPKSWAARMREQQSGNWRTILLAWVGPNWDLNSSQFESSSFS